MKILFTPITSSSIAHMVRSFAIAERLEQDGHEVYFTSCTLKKDFIEKNGFKVLRTYTPFNLNDDSDQSIDYLETHKNELVEWFNAEIQAAKDIDADLVISSPCFFGPHVYFATGKPVIALMNGQYPTQSKGLMGLSLADDSLRSIILRNSLRPLFNRNFIKSYLKHVLDAYRILGIEKTSKDAEGLYKYMDIIIPGDEEFEPMRENTKNIRYVGPIFWDGFERLNGDLSEESLLNFKKDKKLLFVTFGGSVFDKDIYERILFGLSKIDAKKIIALGPNFKREDFPEDSDNIIIKNFVPGLRVSKIADIVINTGSQGAIMQALSMGKPVISFPVGIDQSYFGNRLEEMKLGINVNKTGLLGFSKRESYQFVDNTIPERMCLAIEKILKDNSYTKKAQEYSIRLNKRHSNPIEEMIQYIYEKYNSNH